MAAMAVIVTGADRLQRKLQAQARLVPQLVAGALITEAEVTMTLAKSMTPVDTGRLRASGRVNPPSIGAKIEITMGFYTEYAIYVHEDLSASHPVGRAKFLEAAVTQRRPKIELALAMVVKKAMA